jgi:hypothetical protein
MLELTAETVAQKIESAQEAIRLRMAELAFDSLTLSDEHESLRRALGYLTILRDSFGTDAGRLLWS